MPAKRKENQSFQAQKSWGSKRQIQGAKQTRESIPSEHHYQKVQSDSAKYYGDRLKGVVLYGSMARKQATPTSDIDLLVLLAPPLDYFAHRVVANCKDAVSSSTRIGTSDFGKTRFLKDFEAGSVSLYRNAKREGVTV